MIGVEWGTTRFRAFRLGRDGGIREQRNIAKGIAQVPDGRFGDTLRDEIGPWLAAGEDRVLLCGTIGGSQGWKEAPLVPCPAGIAELASGLVDIGFDWARVKLVPGVSAVDDSGVAEMTLGEEVQVLGVTPLVRDGGLACVPGLHARWLRVRDARIVNVTTHMTGEIFGALRRHTILARTMRDGPSNGAPFDAGIARSAEAGGLLHHLFGVRALTQAGKL